MKRVLFSLKPFPPPSCLDPPCRPPYLFAQETTPLAVGDEEATIRSLFGENYDSGTDGSANSGTNGGALDAAVEEAASTIKDSCMLELLKDRASREGWTEVEARQAIRRLIELRKGEFKEAARADIVNATPSTDEEATSTPTEAPWKLVRQEGVNF